VLSSVLYLVIESRATGKSMSTATEHQPNCGQKKTTFRLSKDGNWRSFSYVPHLLPYGSNGAYFARIKLEGKTIREHPETKVQNSRWNYETKQERKRTHMSKLGVQVMLFDLGGVLVYFDGITPLLALSGNALSREDARRFWLMSPSVRRFETGQSGPEEFAAAAVAELGLAIAPESFLQQFVSWDRGPMDGALNLLDSLRPYFLMACLSNNNELHWRRLRDEMGLAERFHRCYLSHEIGLMKPDWEAFDYVVRDLATSPESILFLDDNPECIAAARAVGMNAYRACGVQEVRAVLSSLGLSRTIAPIQRAEADPGTTSRA
jgi:glucose-1-phosphatase